MNRDTKRVVNKMSVAKVIHFKKSFLEMNFILADII